MRPTGWTNKHEADEQRSLDGRTDMRPTGWTNRQEADWVDGQT